MRALVLGGTGFISGAIVRALHSEGHPVACVTRGKTSGSLRTGVLHILADRATRCRKEIEHFRPDVIVDAIAKTKAEADQAIAVLRRLVERAVVVSSCDVYRAFGAMIEPRIMS